MVTYAVMQPYFYPYINYFNLIRQVDHFVIFDSCQFPRRGRVHRCELGRDLHGEKRWFTLPLSHSPQSTPISEIRFASDADLRLQRQIRKLNENGDPIISEDLAKALQIREDALLRYLIRQLTVVCQTLEIKFSYSLASEFRRPEGLSFEDYIILLGGELGADVYLNLPGGRDLYSASAFENSGIELCFLDELDHVSSSIMVDEAFIQKFHF